MHGTKNSKILRDRAHRTRPEWLQSGQRLTPRLRRPKREEARLRMMNRSCIVRSMSETCQSAEQVNKEYVQMWRGPDSSVGIATRYGLEDPGIESRWWRDFPHPSRPTLGPAQPPIQWVSGLSRGYSGSACSNSGTSWTTHKQHTEYRERNIHNNQKIGIYTAIKKFKTNLWSAGRAPSLQVTPWHLP
jgi:hypothetical protein